MSKKRSKQRRLEATIAHVHQQHGIQALVRGKPPTAIGASSAVPHIPTGFPALDKALGIGGLPKGRLSEFMGPATSGKTTMVHKFLVQAQAGGKQVAYVDQARSFDADYAHRCGLDLDRLLVASPYDLTEALGITEALAGSGGLEAVVFDGMDALWSDSDAARHLAACLDRLAAPVAHSGTTLLFLRAPVPGEQSSGLRAQGSALRAQGSALRALAHHATVRLNVAWERWLRSHGDIRGYEAKVEVLKNRLGPAGRTASIAIKFNGTVRGYGL